MNNVHPRFLESLLLRLPPGSTVVRADVVSPSKSAFTVMVNGEQKIATMTKASITSYLAGQSVEVLADEGDSWESVIQRVSEKYRLFLISGVDYPTTSETVAFPSFGISEKTLEISPDCIASKGILGITVKQRSKFERPSVAVVPDLAHQETQMALLSKISETHDVIIVGAGGLGVGFANGLSQYLIETGVEFVLTAEDLIAAEVLELLNDGISDMAAFKIPSDVDHLWFVRYRLLDASDNTPTG